SLSRLRRPVRWQHPWLRIELAIRAVRAIRLTRGASLKVDQVLMARDIRLENYSGARPGDAGSDAQRGRRPRGYRAVGGSAAPLRVPVWRERCDGVPARRTEPFGERPLHGPIARRFSACALLPRSVGAVAQADAPSAPQRADASVSRAFANLIYVSSVVAQRDTNPSVTREVRGNVRVPGRRSGAGSQAQVVRLNVMQIRAEGSTSSARLGR